MARALDRAGLTIKIGVSLPDEYLAMLDVFVFANPHYSIELCQDIEKCLQMKKTKSGIRVIIDLDRDFFGMPSDMPEYEHLGPGNMDRLGVLQTLLAQVDIVTAPSTALAEKLKQYAKRVEVVPHSWSRSDILWEKPTPKRTMVHLGIVNSHLHNKDLSLIRESVKRILVEEKQVLLVAGGDMDLLNAFTGILDDRKMFVPIGQARDYPFVFSNFDILLVPLRDIKYNLCKTDLPLLEAGIRHIPWVATDIPAFQEWGVGGILAAKKGDWYTALQKLIKNGELRKELGESGRQKAEQREGDVVAQRWIEVFTN